MNGSYLVLNGVGISLNIMFLGRVVCSFLVMGVKCV